jgi:phytoene dehydrogenase-like protein
LTEQEQSREPGQPNLPAEVDAVVIGAGHNGLVAGNRLAEAGWDTLVLEAMPHVGGAVASDREVHPDFVHDTFSAFYPMSAASPVIRSLHLEDWGLRWRHAPAILGHPRPNGEWVMLHRDLDTTADLMEAAHRGDGAAWRRIYQQWRRIEPALIDAILSPFPPVSAGLRALAALPRAGGLSFVRSLLTPVAEQFRSEFGSEGPRLLLAGNASHADIPVDGAGSGFFGLLLSMLAQSVGYPVPEGGAGRLTEAMRDRLVHFGGRVVCDAPVTRVVVERRRVVGVEARGQFVRARRAVLANVHAEHLYGRLLRPEDLPAGVKRGMASFRRDPATVKVDYALSGAVPWASAPPYAPGTVHIADSIDELAIFFGQLTAGLIPEHPFMLVGQMTTADASRSPEGTESLWAYTHVPQNARGDAAGELGGSWDRSDAERFADRMQARIERYAPGFGDRVLARRILTPGDLEARNPSLIGGSLNGGTAALDQQLIFRPIPGNGRPTTPLPGLYLASASAHPGGSVHGACGNNAARAALLHDALRRRTLVGARRLGAGPRSARRISPDSP